MPGCTHQCNGKIERSKLARYAGMLHDRRMTRFPTALLGASALALMTTACAKEPPAMANSEPLASNAAATADAASTLPGRYYLRGVMETAAGLELSEDGSFRWYLIVGALDVIASGRWELTGEKVRLTYEDVKTNGDISELTETILIRSGDNLKPDDGSRGIYVRAKSPVPEADPPDQ
ncbi:MAG: hypothetical protein AAGM33_10425 [Pseudomonadota bacterium]